MWNDQQLTTRDLDFLRRDLEQEIWRLRQDVQRLQQALRDERDNCRSALSEMWHRLNCD